MKLTIATRASKLAVWQANFIRQQLLQYYPDLQIELLMVSTTGDRIQHQTLAHIGGKGLFIKELENALLDGRADLAVHSMKDVPNEIPSALVMAAICERADPRDALLATRHKHFKDLPIGALVGTASVRRRAQLLALRPDLNVADLRGNVDTRINKLLQGNYAAIVLAAAGLERLGLQHHVTEYFNFEQLLPSVAQGALGIECRLKDQKIIELLQILVHDFTHICITNERAFTQRLQVDCFSPVAVYAHIQARQLSIQGLVASLDGTSIIRGMLQGELTDNLGVQLAEQLLMKGAKMILKELHSER